MTHTVLLIDDEPNVLSGLKRVLHKEPYTILTAATAEEAAQILAAQSVDLLVCDEEMPGMSGTEFLSRVAQQYPDTVRIVLTGHPSLPAALRAINEGKVYHFFTKPCNEIELAIAIRQALQEKDLLAKSHELPEATEPQSVLIDEARLMRRLRGAAHEEPA
jgi:DNA-binding NtrC family response regulator